MTDPTALLAEALRIAAIDDDGACTLDDHHGADFAAAILATEAGSTLLRLAAVGAAVERLPDDRYWSIEHHAKAGFAVQPPSGKPALGPDLPSAIAAALGDES